MTLIHTTQEAAKAFGVSSAEAGAEPFPPRYNIAPAQPIVIIRLEAKSRVMALVRWGLIPGWVKAPQNFPLLINARCETVLEKPSFRGSVRHRRCLILASGYYEWRRKGAKKQPFYIRPRGGALMAFAGLWEEWMGPDGEVIETGAILTQKANKTLASIHERMPAFLAPEHYEAWLNVQKFDGKAATALLQPAAEDFFEVTPVSSKVNNARHDGPDLIGPLRHEAPQEPKAQMPLI